VLAQAYNQIGDNCPDLDDPILLKGFFNAVQTLNSQDKLPGYHDRSDGGLLATISEMMFASRLAFRYHSITWAIMPCPPCLMKNWARCCQIHASDCDHVIDLLNQSGLKDCTSS